MIQTLNTLRKGLYMFYKNTYSAEKTFYGITFKPGEIKECKNYINDKWLVRLDNYIAPKDKSVQQKPSPDKSKKEANKSANNEKSAIDETTDHNEKSSDVDSNKS